jgi:hypothetical protein
LTHRLGTSCKKLSLGCRLRWSQGNWLQLFDPKDNVKENNRRSRFLRLLHHCGWSCGVKEIMDDCNSTPRPNFKGSPAEKRDVFFTCCILLVRMQDGVKNSSHFLAVFLLKITWRGWNYVTWNAYGNNVASDRLRCPPEPWECHRSAVCCLAALLLPLFWSLYSGLGGSEMPGEHSCRRVVRFIWVRDLEIEWTRYNELMLKMCFYNAVIYTWSVKKGIICASVDRWPKLAYIGALLRTLPCLAS